MYLLSRKGEKWGALSTGKEEKERAQTVSVSVFR